MLYEVIKQKHIEAMKHKDALLKSAYGNVIAKILVAEKSGNYTLPLEDSIIESLIVKELKELEEKFPLLITSDSPTQRVGGISEKFNIDNDLKLSNLIQIDNIK